ncbi:PilZ domain-containing protein [Marinobacterium lutimaris]|uniref:Alginate biosynthesis protein Alg44 n=1 Tax=Marinobacterium lutimaris TaxID=568106 RepID=A0A1H6CW09_9GAMM|nr:PilZ domain-containing protein [Marinobacterium lutimaris]SEG77182.1 alginate biosynthesis protein Alg44 [Marinobacterium lutimaris]
MSTTVLNDSVVHEAIDERQHIRTRIPARAVLTSGSSKAISCDVQDISIGGLGLHCEETLKIGSLYDASIELDMKRIDLSLKAKVKIVKQHGANVGAQFVDLEPSKADILRYIISSYLSGEVADINGLFSVMQRENYIKERKQKANLTRGAWQRLKAVLGTLFMMAIGVLALTYVLYQIYSLFFRIPAAQAAVSADAYVISMPENGTVTYLLPEGQQEVSVGQPVASISTQLTTSLTSPADLEMVSNLSAEDTRALLGGINVDTVISSPCDCTPFYPAGQLDSYGYKGDALVHLLPREKPLYVNASVAFDKLEKLQRTRDVQLQVYGADEKIAGKIVGATVNREQDTVELKIEPESALSLDDYQKPVWVAFELGLPGIDRVDGLNLLERLRQ